MRDDSLLRWVAAVLWTCCAAVVVALAGTGALADGVNAVLATGLVAWTAGVTLLLVRGERRSRATRRRQLRQIERLVAALRER